MWLKSISVTILFKLKRICMIGLLVGLASMVYVVLKPDGICHPARNVLCLAVSLSFAQNLSDGVANTVAPRVPEPHLSPPNRPAIGDSKPKSLLDTWTADDSPAANGCVPIRKKPCN